MAQSNSWSKWLVGGAAASAAIGLVLYHLYGSDQKKKEDRVDRKHVEQLVETGFQSHKAEIIKFIATQEWNHFSVAQLRSIHSHFLELLQQSGGGKELERGFMSAAMFEYVLRHLGMDDDAVVSSFYRSWDRNKDGHIDFVELLEELNVMCFGEMKQQLVRYFNVYDLDGNGFISRSELSRLFHVFLKGADEAEIATQVQRFMALADFNQDDKISFQEFVQVAERRGLNLNVAGGFHRMFATIFGIDLNSVHEGATATTDGN
jgi:Ca2+-binding EF-hand superfamily protein